MVRAEVSWLVVAALAGACVDAPAQAPTPAPARTSPTPVAARPPAEEPPPPAAPIAEPAPRLERAHVIIDDAIGRGHWTAADRDQLSAQMRELDGEDLEATLVELFAAINAGTLTVDLDGPPI